MASDLDISLVCELCHYLGKRYPTATPGTEDVTVSAGNRERGVLYFHVWIKPATCIAVCLAQRDCTGRSLEEIKKTLDTRLNEAVAEAMKQFKK